MQLKDGEYLKRNILAIYGKHYDEGKSFPYYRFMGQMEFETLFQEKNVQKFRNLFILHLRKPEYLTTNEINWQFL